MRNRITRRSALISMLAATAAAVRPRAFAGCVDPERSMEKAAKYVHPKLSWSYAELNEFLTVLPDEGLLSLKKSLQMIPHDDETTAVDDREKAQKDIQTQLLWVSSNILAYPFRNQKKISYHDLTKWAAGELGVDPWILDTQPTLVIERAIQENLFVGIWDKMSVEQRTELLTKIDANGKPATNGAGAIAQDGKGMDYLAVASLSGAGALAALSMTVHLAGFAFYTTMSTVICTAAGFFGITLPFAAYTGASTIVAFLSGPVGWALLAVAAAAGVAFAGSADSRKTAAAICQLHALKIAALQAANVKATDAFQAMGDPIKRQLVGEWSFSGETELIEFQLASDGSFTARSFLYPTEENKNYVKLWDGKGDWSVRDKKFTVTRTHTWSYVRWSQNEKILFDNAVVRNITLTELQLADDLILTRI